MVGVLHTTAAYMYYIAVEHTGTQRVQQSAVALLRGTAVCHPSAGGRVTFHTHWATGPISDITVVL